MNNNWRVYLLLNDGNTRTYIGATVNPDRRLRQHNNELVGGAKATSGDQWKRVCLVSGFPDERAALQFEWTWKHLGRKVGRGHCLERRYKALADLLERGKSSSTSVAFDSYPAPGLSINIIKGPSVTWPIFEKYVYKFDVDTYTSVQQIDQLIGDQTSHIYDQPMQVPDPGCHLE